jgi:hypothetical protein
MAKTAIRIFDPPDEPVVINRPKALGFRLTNPANLWLNANGLGWIQSIEKSQFLSTNIKVNHVCFQGNKKPGPFRGRALNILR